METRTYESIYPFIGNVTVTLIKEIKEMGAYSFLSEYGNALGMLMMSELSRRRIRSLNKFIKIGKIEVVVVVRVDFSKGYIDLSKRRIAEGETFCMEKKWNYSRIVNTITYQVSKSFFIETEDSRIRWTWPFFRFFGHAIIAFKKFLENSEILTKSFDIFWKENLKIYDIVKKKLPKTSKKISSNFEISCFSAGGISIVKNVIKIAIMENNLEKINVRLISGPLYNLTIKNRAKKKAMKIFIKFFSLISEKIKKKKGRLHIKNIILD
mmetsp:Transcript_12705/g.31953  ORF Transcript_12705/g.31953 Transcript_12705/m.31953 type:complete len:267 (-) Transcript_12705:1336-2136(-)